MVDEPILRPSRDRFTVFPIEHEDIFKFYKDAIASFWTAEEIQLQQDLIDWKKLSSDEQHFVKYVLGFFAGSDGVVAENLAVRFYDEVQYAEARQYYATQIMIEAIHAEVYSLLIDTYVTDPDEKSMLFRAIDTLPTVTEKAQWAIRWIDSSQSFGERLLAFAVVEGIFFSSSFCAIYWLKERNLLPGLTFANELIARDEGVHTDFAVHIYNNHIMNKIPESRIIELVRSGVEIEEAFVRQAVPVRLIGMNADLMVQYVQFVADRLVKDLGIPAIYGVDNPFPFMDKISVQNKSNFFETRVGAYAKTGSGVSREEMNLSLDADV